MKFNHHRRCQHEMYRLTCAEFDELYLHADGCCQICGTPEAETKAGRLGIDHDGSYGWHAVRGLLCDKCNALMRRVDNRERWDATANRYRYGAWFMRTLAATATARKAAAKSGGKS